MDSESVRASSSEKLEKSHKKGKVSKRVKSNGARSVSSPSSSSLTARSTAAIVPVSIPMNAATRDQVSQYALLASITGGNFEDVKFYVFSRKMRSGRVDTPLPLFGNSALIRKASSYFDFVLTKGFAESKFTNVDAPFPSDHLPFTDQYDYGSDSDLEDEVDADEPVSTVDEPFQERAEPQVPEMKDSQLKENSKHGAAGIREVPTLNAPGRRGRVVFIEDIAYRTWQAFLFYAYFNKVSFAPLRSQEQPCDIKVDPFEPPSCSPKSMYRLAEKYGIESLKKLAADDIKSKLTKHNILAELFSSFTLLHPEIQTLEMDFLYEHIASPTLLSRLPMWFQYLEDGELPEGAAKVFSTLVKKLVAGGLRR